MRYIGQMRVGRVLPLALFFAAIPAHADDPRFHANDIRTLFVIAKNIDRNEVQFGIHLDRSCQPVGDEPIYAYWRQFERGADVTEDLTFLDRTVYGIGSQKVLERTPDKSKVLMTIKAAPDRGVAIITKSQDGKCVAQSVALINGQPSDLERVFVHVAGFMSVDWVELRGRRAGEAVVERVKH